MAFRFYLCNLKSNTEQPLEIFINGSLVLKRTEDIGPKEILIHPVDISDEVIKLQIKIPSIRLDHSREINIKTHGKHMKIHLDEVKKSLGINQQHKPYETENLKVLGEGIPEEPKTKEEKTPVPEVVVPKDKVFSKLNLFLKDLPGSSEDPFDIVFSGQIVFKVDRKFEKSTQLTVNIPPSSSINLGVNSKKYKDVKRDFDLTKGDNIQISLENEGISLLQSQDSDFSGKKPFENSNTSQLTPQVKAVEQIHFFMTNMPGRPDDPFQLFFEDEMVYSLEDEIEDGNVHVTVNLPDPETKIKIGVKSKRYPFIEKVFDLINVGVYIQVCCANNKLNFQHQNNDKFPVIEDKCVKEERLNFYLLNCKASKENPFFVRFNHKTVQNLLEIDKEIIGSFSDIKIPMNLIEKDEFIEMEVRDSERNLQKKGILKYKDGLYFKIEVDGENIMIDQQKNEFEFSYNSQKKITATKTDETKDIVEQLNKEIERVRQEKIEKLKKEEEKKDLLKNIKKLNLENIKAPQEIPKKQSLSMITEIPDQDEKFISSSPVNDSFMGSPKGDSFIGSPRNDSPRDGLLTQRHRSKKNIFEKSKSFSGFSSLERMHNFSEKKLTKAVSIQLKRKSKDLREKVLPRNYKGYFCNFNAVFKYEDVTKGFVEHLRFESNVEPFEFLMEVESLPDDKSRDAALIFFSIYETFIKPGSEKTINISGVDRELIKGYFDKEKNNVGFGFGEWESPIKPRAVLEKARGTVYADLRFDSYPRFINSDLGYSIMSKKLSFPDIISEHPLNSVIYKIKSSLYEEKDDETIKEIAENLTDKEKFINFYFSNTETSPSEKIQRFRRGGVMKNNTTVVIAKNYKIKYLVIDDTFSLESSKGLFTSKKNLEPHTEFLREALLIGPYLLEWNDTELCIPGRDLPKKVILCVDLDEIRLEQFKLEKLAEKIISWNVNKSYRKDPEDLETTGNSQNFVQSILEALGLKITLHEPAKEFLEKAKKTMDFKFKISLSSTFKKTFNMKESTIEFPSNQELEKFVSKVYEIDKDFQKNFPGEYQLLKSFDRSLWISNQTIINQIKTLKKQMDEIENQKELILKETEMKQLESIIKKSVISSVFKDPVKTGSFIL